MPTLRETLFPDGNVPLADKIAARQEELRSGNSKQPKIETPSKPATPDAKIIKPKK